MFSGRYGKGILRCDPMINSVLLRHAMGELRDAVPYLVAAEEDGQHASPLVETLPRESMRCHHRGTCFPASLVFYPSLTRTLCPQTAQWKTDGEFFERL